MLGIYGFVSRPYRPYLNVAFSDFEVNEQFVAMIFEAKSMAWKQNPVKRHILKILTRIEPSRHEMPGSMRIYNSVVHLGWRSNREVSRMCFFSGREVLPQKSVLIFKDCKRFW